MDHSLGRRLLLGAGSAGLAGLLTPRLAAAQPAGGKKFKIALSNSYIGNKWRLEMENVFKAALLMEPFASQVEGSVFNSGNDVSKQSQQISNLIAERVDAIVLDAASPTALNGIIQQATGRGILVVCFDNNVTAPSALKVNISQAELPRQRPRHFRQRRARGMPRGSLPAASARRRVGRYDQGHCRCHRRIKTGRGVGASRRPAVRLRPAAGGAQPLGAVRPAEAGRGRIRRRRG